MGSHAQDEYRMSPGACRVSQRGSRLALDDNGAPLDARWGFLGLTGLSRKIQDGPGGAQGFPGYLQRPLKAMWGSLDMPWL